jgi:hypothetical protein
MTKDTNFAPVCPHGKVVKVFDDVYMVEGSFPMLPGVRIGRAMTIVKNGDDLTVINSIRVDEETEEEIKKLGTIKNLVRLCTGHGLDDPYYFQTFKPKYYSVAKEPMANAPHDVNLTEESEVPIPDAKVIVFKNIPKGAEPECAMLIPQGGSTLVTVDAIQNGATPDHSSFLGRNMTYMLGFNHTCNCPPLWRHNNGMDHWNDMERILALEWDNLCTGHGPAMVGGAKAAVEKNLKAIWKKE